VRGDFLFSNVLNLTSVFDQPILVGHCPGSAGAALEDKTDAENLAMMMRIFRTAWNIPDAEDKNAAFSRWHLDPFSVGAYPYLKIGTHPELFDILRRRIRTVTVYLRKPVTV
jgi:hypothetical protein